MAPTEPALQSPRQPPRSAHRGHRRDEQPQRRRCDSDSCHPLFSISRDNPFHTIGNRAEVTFDDDPDRAFFRRTAGPYGNNLVAFGTQAAEDRVIVNFQPTRVGTEGWRQLIPSIRSDLHRQVPEGARTSGCPLFCDIGSEPPATSMVNPCLINSSVVATSPAAC